MSDHSPRVLLGVTGGIAAYKSPDLVRRLREQGIEVQVVMTEGAKQFITPLTLQAVSGRPVRDSLWDRAAEAAMGHIELARWADLVIVAPASADFLARLSQGEAGDLLATICLATSAPIHVAPAMNRLMWASEATQANVRKLRERGVTLHGPGVGEQACGETGEGRMLEPAELAAAVASRLAANDALAGLKVVVTAGPTREKLDPVRFISNRSSGKMGYSVAQAASEAGARVVLVSGPVNLASPPGVRRVSVESAAEMHAAVHAEIGDADVFIGSAAVADYTPQSVSAQKIKKRDDSMRLELVKAPDILASVAALARRPFVVGFAAETERVEEHARDKLVRKRLDLIAANQVGEGLAFDREDNALTVLWDGGRQELGSCNKLDLARRLVAHIAEARRVSLAR
ncbi:MAG: bifunctional phosphopantothenoylcysteine decarboxylase/phosphopantothenate--cysteine ligase CoaBC [Gammaproteobacteria bacterium]|nr:bifunctional phosphopantothenoylcysteine decarboxylase/phosphopantothenate--cysteine ligase CoaBC [Gammaproteobacteria bacterium]